MGQFKPMVKMETTEPSVILKLKKGGHVMSKAQAKEMDGHQPMGKADGGKVKSPFGPMISAVKSSLKSAGKSFSNKTPSPSKPSMMDRAKAMKANQPGSMMGMVRKAAQSMPSNMPTRTSPTKPQGLMGKTMAMARKAAMTNSPRAVTADRTASASGLKMEQEDASKKLASMPSFRNPSENRAVKGTVMPTFGKMPDMSSEQKQSLPRMKHGGESKKVHASEMKKMSGLSKELKSHAGKPASKAHAGLKTGGVVAGQGGFKTGGVIKGNAGYKKGGEAKKFADGGAVQDDGRAVKMPQGNKRPSKPVSINQLSGTFKRGGKVNKYSEGGDAQTEKSQRGYKQYEEEDKRFNESLREDMGKALSYPFRKIKELFSDSPAPKGSVTKTKESVTVAKKAGGKC